MKKSTCALLTLITTSLLASPRAHAWNFYVDGMAPSLDPNAAEMLFDPSADPGNCQNSVDPKRILLMIDFNSSYREMWAAKKSACERGMKFVLIPDESVSVSVGRKHEAMKYAYDQYSYLSDRCGEDSTSSDPRCSNGTRDALYKKAEELEREVEAAAKPYEFDPNVELNKKVTELSRQGAKIVSLVLSGHHSGGSFYGENLTSTDLDDSSFFSVVSRNKDLFSDVHFLGLWGCSGVTQGEVTKWRVGIPSIEVVAGFYDSAPLGIRNSSYEFLGDIVAKARDLSNISNPQTLKAAINGVKHARSTYSSVYVHTAANEDYIYFNKPRESGEGIQNFFEPLTNEIRCQAFRTQRLPGHLTALKAWYSGAEPLPQDSQTSPLRRVYFDMLQNHDCYPSNLKDFQPHQIGLMRFFESGVKQNFAGVFASEIQASERELQALNPRAIRDRLSSRAISPLSRQVADKRREIEAAEQEITQLKEGFEGRFKSSPSYKAALAKIDAQYEELPKRLRRKIGDTFQQEGLSATREKIGAMKSRLQRKSESYLLALNELENLQTRVQAKHTNEIDEIQSRVNSAKNESSRIERDLNEAQSRVDTTIGSLEDVKNRIGSISISQVLETGTRKDILAVISKLDPYFGSSARMDRTAQGEFPATRAIYTRLNRMLRNLDADCMPFLEWHEHSSSRLPQVRCQL